MWARRRFYVSHSIIIESILSMQTNRACWRLERFIDLMMRFIHLFYCDSKIEFYRARVPCFPCLILFVMHLLNTSFPLFLSVSWSKCSPSKTNNGLVNVFSFEQVGFSCSLSFVHYYMHDLCSLYNNKIEVSTQFWRIVNVSIKSNEGHTELTVAAADRALSNDIRM